MVQRLKLFFVLFLFIILMNFSFTSALFGNNEIIRTRSININNFTFNGTGTETDPYWKANWSNFTLLYQNQLGNTSSGISWAIANNGTLLNYSNALNGSVETKWNGNWSNFTLLYQNQLGNTSSGISWAVANNGTLLNYSNALNNTLMQQANWNSTNISYRQIINHTFYNSTNIFFGINTSSPKNTLNILGDINITGANGNMLFNPNQAPSTQFNITSDNFYFTDSGAGSLVTIDDNGFFGIKTFTPQNTLNVIGDINATTTIWSYGLNLTKGYQYALNSSGVGWATINNGTMLNYSSALNNTLMQQANWNATNVSYLTVANWNSTNTSYYLVSNPSLFYNITQNDINFNLTSYFNITNQTVSHFYINASNGRIGFGTTTPQNTLNVIGIINATKEIFSYGLNLTTGYGYALNASGISWATANNGTLLNYSNALNGTLVNQSYLTTWNFYNVTNFPQNASLMTYANWNATNSTYRTGDNNTFVANNITVTNLYVVNGTGGAYIRHNGTGWLIVG